MLIFKEPLPLSLYIHIPWCVRKCPYCDFNSHEIKQYIPETAYIDALIEELDSRMHLVYQRPIKSIFFGGGTPSLFSAQAIERILSSVAKRMHLPPDVEITLEANPGTIEHARFSGFHTAGINRLSLGIQSFHDDKLKTLGRIHDSAQAKKAVQIARNAGFQNFNLDIMYGLPQQNISEVKQDIAMALSFAPTHFSWYQLTIEPNTVFYRQTPAMPSEDITWDMQLAGLELIREAGFHQYEVSAYSEPKKECRHNYNYWEFGDYLGIGAGAHSKITDHQTGTVMRFAQVRHPKDYLDANKRQPLNINAVRESDLPFEFMLNALRLTQGVTMDQFIRHTGLTRESIASTLSLAQARGLMTIDNERLCVTDLGMKFLNDVTAMFLS